jgi:hypothetical protein
VWVGCLMTLAPLSWPAVDLWARESLSGSTVPDSCRVVYGYRRWKPQSRFSVPKHYTPNCHNSLLFWPQSFLRNYDRLHHPVSLV